MARKNAQAEDLSNVEFETSEDVEVIPTFSAMNLKEELLRGIYAYGKHWIYSIRHKKFVFLNISVDTECVRRFRKALCYTAAQHQTNRKRPRRYRTGTVRYGQDGHFLHFYTTKSGHDAAWDTGAMSVANTRVGCTNSKGHSCPGRHDECSVSCMHWWYQFGWGH